MQVIDEIESNEDQDGKALYHRTEVKRYIQERNYIRNHAEEIVQKICSCLKERYGTVFDKYSQGRSDSRYVISDEGDHF